jgi:hypothetical protein
MSFGDAAIINVPDLEVSTRAGLGRTAMSSKGCDELGGCVRVESGN